MRAPRKSYVTVDSPARSSGDKRDKSLVEATSFGMFDEDAGTPTTVLIEKIAALGFNATIATTHSHMKSNTAIPATKFDELAAAGMTPAEMFAKLKG